MERTTAVLQGLLTTVAEEVGRRCGLIQRRHEFTSSMLVATFVLGFLRHPRPRCCLIALRVPDEVVVRRCQQAYEMAAK